MEIRKQISAPGYFEKQCCCSADFTPDSLISLVFSEMRARSPDDAHALRSNGGHTGAILTLRKGISGKECIISIFSLAYKFFLDCNHQQQCTLTENCPVGGASIKKAEILYGYFDIYSYPQMSFGKVKGLYGVLFLNHHIKWGRFGPSKLGQNFFVFQIFVSSRVFFAIKSC